MKKIAEEAGAARRGLLVVDSAGALGVSLGLDGGCGRGGTMSGHNLRAGRLGRLVTIAAKIVVILVLGYIHRHAFE